MCVCVYVGLVGGCMCVVVCVCLCVCLLTGELLLTVFCSMPFNGLGAPIWRNNT